MVLFLSSLHYGVDYMAFQWACGFAILSLILGYTVAKKTSVLVGAFLAYALITATYVIAFTENKWFGSRINQGMICSSAFAMIAILLLSVTQYKVSKKALAWYAIIDSVYVILGYLFLGKLSGNGYNGFIDYSSINGAMIGCLYGFVMAELPWLTILPVIAVILSKSSIPYGALALTLAAYWLHQKKYKNMTLGSVSILLFGWITCKFYAAHPLFLNGAADSRYSAYRFFMTEWWKKSNHFFGTGPGTFHILGPLSQMEKGYDFTKYANGGFQGSLWYWIHSDWLQCVFELGFVGFILAVLVYSEAFWKLFRMKHKPAEFSLFVGLGGVAIFDYPLKYFPTAFLFALAVKAAYNKMGDE